MIVRPFRGRLLTVRQTDHMAVAARLADAWGNDQFARPEPFGPLALGAAEHDVGWAEWEAAPKIDPATRRPYQFTDVPVDEHLAFYQRGVSTVAAVDAHAGLLVNLHCQGFHCQRFGTTPDMPSRQLPHAEAAALRKALTGLQSHQRTLGRQVPVDSAVLWTQYELLQIFDRLSLYLCMPPLPLPWTELGPVPLAVGGTTVNLALTPAHESLVSVNPWPFREPVVPTEFPGRLIADRDYANDADLRRELAAAEPVTLRYKLRPVT
jgi:hypothetical protein